MSLDDLRAKIDEIDHRLVALLNERAEIAREIGRLKSQMGHTIIDPAREQAVLDRVAAANRGPLSQEALQSIYTAIISASRALQHRPRVAYLGPEATFSHQAALGRFGPAVDYVPARTIPEIFLLTEKGQADFGVVPVENSTEGMVSHTLDSFVDSDLKVCAEISLPITQNLLSRSPLAEIKRIYSHPQAIAQTRSWVSAHLPMVEIIEVTSTARAAEMAAQEKAAAAIATELAASVYGLDIVAPRIEDNPFNITRFLVIGPTMGTRTGHDKTALLLSVKHEVGALHTALGTLQRHGLNMTKIESRPARQRPWEYLFFVDILGHPDDEPVAIALRELSDVCVFLKVLGAWPIEAR